MTNRLILPPNYPDINAKEPVIFLAGPIQGAPDWQNQAIDYIKKQAPHVYIACPKKEYLDGTFIYSEQVDWESHFLQRASQNGCVLFFLAKELTPIKGRAYAQTSRFELGEWSTKQAQSQCNMVVGIQEGFSNARYIRHRLSQGNPSIPILNNLEETCQNAIDLVNRNNC